MTVENLQMSADKPDIVDKPSTLYHYTSEKGLTGILDTGTLNPSLKANNPKDARYGNGQYLRILLQVLKVAVNCLESFMLHHGNTSKLLIILKLIQMV